MSMRSRWSRYRALVVIFVAILIQGREVTANEGERGAYFSLVTKDSVERYFNRLSDGSVHFVATSTPVTGAKESVWLKSRPEERLVLVELQPGGSERLPGELRRMGNFAVLSLSYSEDLHMIGGRNLYGEELATKELDWPKVRSKRTHEMHSIPLFTSDEQLQKVPAIDQKQLIVGLRQLSGDVETQVGGRQVRITERRLGDNKQLARAWLKQEYEALGFTVREESYGGVSFGSNANFVAERVGSDGDGVFIVSSHLDSVGNAGADDNASGTVAALAVARALRDVPLKYTLRVIAFDEEELGLVGSKAYVRSLMKSGEAAKVRGVINLEMLAYNKRADGAFHVIDCDENESADISTVFRQVASGAPELRLHPVQACTSRSDHASFWRAGIPAVVVSENFFGGDGNPCYHKACDKFATVDVDYLIRTATLVARVVAAINGD